jgi:hypothetical protein
MRRLGILITMFILLIGISVITASASSASTCQSDGTGCTKAGTYPGPYALINKDFHGFKIVWTKSVVRPYSSGVPLYWNAYATYTNITGSTLSLRCSANPGDLSSVQEHMSGGSGDDGTVSASATLCTNDPGWRVEVPPKGTAQSYSTFHNVPWPGSAVSLTWTNQGTTPYVYPFQSGEACVFNAPKGASLFKGRLVFGHVGWAYLANPFTGVWEFGANEGPDSHDVSKTWDSHGSWAQTLKAFKDAWPGSGAHRGYFHSGGYYKTYRCIAVKKLRSSGAFSVVRSQSGESYRIPDRDCLSETVEVLGAYGAGLSEHDYLLSPADWAPNSYYDSKYMSKFGPRERV